LIENRQTDERRRHGLAEIWERAGGKGERSIREFLKLLVMALTVIFRSGGFGRKECVDEGGLSQTQLALIRG
jgi:hypothetical protein